MGKYFSESVIPRLDRGIQTLETGLSGQAGQ